MLQAPSSLPATAAEEAPIYAPTRPWRSRMVPVRTMEYHVREWGPVDGDPALAPLVLVHGWMDVAASYQFVVDAFGELCFFLQQKFFKNFEIFLFHLNLL